MDPSLHYSMTKGNHYFVAMHLNFLHVFDCTITFFSSFLTTIITTYMKYLTFSIDPFLYRTFNMTPIIPKDFSMNFDSGDLYSFHDIHPNHNSQRQIFPTIPPIFVNFGSLRTNSLLWRIFLIKEDHY